MSQAEVRHWRHRFGVLGDVIEIGHAGETLEVDLMRAGSGVVCTTAAEPGNRFTVRVKPGRRAAKVWIEHDGQRIKLLATARPGAVSVDVWAPTDWTIWVASGAGSEGK